jgi:hypothetical protein
MDEQKRYSYFLRSGTQFVNRILSEWFIFQFQNYGVPSPPSSCTGPAAIIDTPPPASVPDAAYVIPADISDIFCMFYFGNKASSTVALHLQIKFSEANRS